MKKERRSFGKYFIILELCLIGLLGTFFMVKGVLSASNHTVSAANTISFTADPIVDAELETFVNGVSKGKVTFVAGDLTSTTKTLTLGDIQIENVDGKFEASIKFVVKNTSPVATNVLTVNGTRTGDLNNLTVSSVTAEQTAAQGAVLTYEYVFTVTDIHLDAAVASSWNFALSATK